MGRERRVKFTDEETLECHEPVVFKSDDISIDNEELISTSDQLLSNCSCDNSGPNCNEEDHVANDEDVKPDLTALENLIEANAGNENSHLAIISSENQAIVFEKVKTETSSDSDDSESEDLGAVLTDEEMSPEAEQEWKPCSSKVDDSDFESLEEDDDANQSNSDSSWTENLPKAPKARKSRPRTEKVENVTTPKTKTKKMPKKPRVIYKRLSCHYCEQKFPDNKDLRRHIISRHERDKCPYKCPLSLCKFISAYGHDLVRHLKNMHGTVQTEDGDYVDAPPEKTGAQNKSRKELHKCPECSKICSTAAHLRTHVESHAKKAQKTRAKRLQNPADDAAHPKPTWRPSSSSESFGARQPRTRECLLHFHGDKTSTIITC